jgi:putative phosphoribosyl transferase
MLAKKLLKYAGPENVIILGIPRGGVPVAFEVAQVLGAPLDVFLSRKLGVPGQEELAFGAMATGGVRVLDADIVEAVGISNEQIEAISEREREELDRRERLFRADSPPLEVSGKTAILVDDGIATGSSMLAAVAALRQLKPARIVIAVPVAPASTCNRLRREVDEIVCVESPEFFYAIGQFYEDFSQVSDSEVCEVLHRAKRDAVRDAA